MVIHAKILICIFFFFPSIYIQFNMGKFNNLEKKCKLIY